MNEKPLEGINIVVTRSQEDQLSAREQIQTLGGNAIACPMIALWLPHNCEPLDDALSKLSQFDWIFFTSPNSVNFFFLRMKQKLISAKQIRNIRVAVVGEKTARQFENIDITPEFISIKATGKAFAESFLKKYNVENKKVLLPLSSIARRTVPDRLKEAGACITEVIAYENHAVDDFTQEFMDYFCRNMIHWVAFTSSSTVENFHKCLQKNRINLPDATKLASIGPQTTITLQNLLRDPDVEASPHTFDGLLDAISKHL